MTVGIRWPSSACRDVMAHVSCIAASMLQGGVPHDSLGGGEQINTVTNRSNSREFQIVSAQDRVLAEVLAGLCALRIDTGQHPGLYSQLFCNPDTIQQEGFQLTGDVNIVSAARNREGRGESEKITLNLGHVDLGRIDLLVKEGFAIS